MNDLPEGIVQAGSVVHVAIDVRDRFGNSISAKDDKVAVTASGASKVVFRESEEGMFR